MGTEENGSRERGAWTPFVGGALAALTAGSLIVFSLVAQKTSLEGFSSRGVTAISPSVSAPRSITLPGGATDAAVDSVALTPGQEAGSTALSTLTSSTSTTTAAAGDDVAPASDTATTTSTGSTRVAAAPNPDNTGDGTFSGRLAGGGAGPNLFREGPDNDGAENKKAKKAKGKKAKGKDRSHKKSHRGGRKHDRSQANKSRGHSGAVASRSRGRSGSRDPAASSRPQHSSRPAPPPQPQQASKPKPKPAPPGHAKSNGNGHSKGRGKGHAKHH